MQKNLLIGAAAAALLIADIELTSRDSTSGGPPFLDPTAIANSICGKDKDGIAKRRAFFQ